MGSAWIPILSTALGALITFLATQLIEYRKRIGPRLEYLATRATPIRIDGKTVAGYEVRVSNLGGKKVEKVTIHLRANFGKLSVQEVDVSPGLEWQMVGDPNDSSVKLFLPYLKQGESLKTVVVAEAIGFVYETIEVMISSPNELRVKRRDASEPASGWFPTLAGIATILLAVLAFYMGSRVQSCTDEISRASQAPVKEAFRPDVRDRVVSAASTAGLPQFAELYSTMQDPKYYEEGDIAFALAVASGKKDEINRYRSLLSSSLDGEPRMAPESQANVLYCLGKIDLLLADDDAAVSHFKDAMSKSRTTVEDRAKSDPPTRRFLLDHGLL